MEQKRTKKEQDNFARELANRQSDSCARRWGLTDKNIIVTSDGRIVDYNESNKIRETKNEQ